MKSQIQGGVYHLMLYYGNSSGVDIQDFVTSTPTVDYLQIQSKTVAPVIAAGQQASQLFSVGCLKVSVLLVFVILFLNHLLF